MIRFSIVVPLYNDLIGLNRLLCSLRDQVFRNFEVVIVDDGSDISYSEVLNQYKSININYVKIVNSGSPSTPRNIGLSMSSGDYICFLDSDDFYGPDTLSTLDGLVLRKSINFFCMRYFNSDGKQIIYEDKVIGNYRRFNGKLSDLFEFNYIPTSGVCINRNDLINIDALPFKENTIEDWFLWLTLCKEGFGLNKIPLVLGFYNYHPNVGMSSRYTFSDYLKVFSAFYRHVSPVSIAYHLVRLFYIRLILK